MLLSCLQAGPPARAVSPDCQHFAEQPLCHLLHPGSSLSVGCRPAGPQELCLVNAACPVSAAPSLQLCKSFHPGSAGLAASELYVVKDGEFEVLERRQGVNMRVNMKHRGDTFGEISLMYNSPRSATVAATQDSVVWVLERTIFRYALL